MSKEDSIQTTQPWGFLATLLWGGLIFLAFIISQMLAMGAYIGYHYGAIADEQIDVLMLQLQNDGTVLSICTITSLAVCSGLLAVIVKLKKTATIKGYLALNAVSFNESKRWFAYMLIALIVIDLTTMLVGKAVIPPFMEEVYDTASPMWLLWLAIVVAAPIFEEVFFRGFLLAGLSSSFMGSALAVITTSALWAVIHFQYELYYIVTIFLFGLLLGIARLKTGSTLLTIIMHGAINFIALLQVTFMHG